VFSRLWASENLVADKASAHTLNCDEDLADLICSDGCGASFLGYHDFPPSCYLPPGPAIFDANCLNAKF
jgi:hypothetical protein